MNIKMILQIQFSFTEEGELIKLALCTKPFDTTIVLSRKKSVGKLKQREQIRFQLKFPTFYITKKNLENVNLTNIHYIYIFLPCIKLQSTTLILVFLKSCIFFLRMFLLSLDVLLTCKSFT